MIAGHWPSRPHCDDSGRRFRAAAAVTLLMAPAAVEAASSTTTTATTTLDPEQAECLKERYWSYFLASR